MPLPRIEPDYLPAFPKQTLPSSSYVYTGPFDDGVNAIPKYKRDNANKANTHPRDTTSIPPIQPLAANIDGNITTPKPEKK